MTISFVDKFCKDPYIKNCAYYFCKKEFTARRTNQKYCCPDCKSLQDRRRKRLRRYERDLEAQKTKRKLLELKQRLENERNSGESSI
jgi:predicted sulfurtransferase